MLQCSHILCKVDKLAETVNQLQQAGFSMQWGSRPDKAHNALLWFEQGPFIEFFELPRFFSALSLPFGWRFGRPAGQRLAHWAKAAPGWCDIALEPQLQSPAAPLALEPICTYLQQKGIACSRVINGRRICPQGDTVQYRFIAPYPVNLPFIVSHYHPLQRPERIVHRNGARAIRRVEWSLPAENYWQLQRLLPSDRWLSSSITPQRHIGAVTLDGWRAAGNTTDFIRHLFREAR